MKWFLLAVMTMVYDGNAKDIYVWQQPNFESLEQCSTWVKDNNQSIFFTLKEQFPNDAMDRLLCVRQDKLEKFLKASTLPGIKT